MKAIQFDRYGGPDVLGLVDIAAPHAGPGEVRISVRAAGVNPSDWKRRAGLYRDFEDVSFPAGVGVEAAGVVDEVGEGVAGVAVGDAVFGFGNGTVAQCAVLTHWAPKPDLMPFDVAAGVPVVFETASRALDELGLGDGRTLLVSGGAGGIGTAVIQLARLRGLSVIATASAAKQDYVRELGAVATTYGPGLAERVRLLAPDGVDGALDVAGSGVLPELIGIVGEARRVLSVADLSAESYGAKFSLGPPQDPVGALLQAARLWSEGRFRLHIDRTFPLAETAEAHAVSSAGHVTGKLVIAIG
ncbi:MAG: NADP-dependent oxidoreductase [Telmatospirillum sp.]|nr:NADP-dependent oxidoreductase [Telmatospirillum sp.]